MTDALVARGNARNIPLADRTVDLIVTSPPYFGQRAYFDGDERYDGQLGSEPTPQEFLTALWDVMRDCWRVLKDDGVAFVNLGDKRSGSGAPGTTSGLTGRRTSGRPIPGQARSYTSGSDAGSTLEGTPQQRARVQGERSGMAGGYTKAAFGRAKSKQLIPHRFAIGCEDGLADPDGIGWIVRSELVWEKPNGLPESVNDRTRDNLEYWFMLCKQGSYYANIDEIRVPHSGGSNPGRKDGAPPPGGATERLVATGDHGGNYGATNPDLFNPRGKLPGSVWTIATEGLSVPAWVGVDHFAAFPSEWPRRLILGWSPPGICTCCGTGRFLATEGYVCACTPFTDNRGKRDGDWRDGRNESADHMNAFDTGSGNNVPRRPGGFGTRIPPPEKPIREYHLNDWTPAPTRPAVVLDPFGGTGTTAMVARALGRTGISLDLSNDYCRVARWRIFESGHNAKIESRTNADRQGTLL